MIEITGNIWNQKATVLCITTNEILRKDGALVMGRGIAKQCAFRNPDIEFSFGEYIKQNGSIFQVTHCLDKVNFQILALFPVKQHWRQMAKLSIITDSALHLGQFAFANLNSIFTLPRPGCGNGGLLWTTVKPVIEKLLPNNVHIIYEEGHN